ncbi:MAG TPA: hydrogenase expression/formation protein HypE [Candidatus Acetothermia bacterium]|nr:hydrogenase expression/formation protein HypE [Candidatus Acetothermia bacterium]
MRKPLSEDKVTALHGAGGELMQRFLAEVVLPRIPLKAAGPVGLADLDDGAVLSLPEGQVVVTTDSHVVKPIFFPGGDIGKLAACGTINDLAVMGARPVALTLSLILEEGFSLSDLERILSSLAAVLKELGVALVTGDTKVMGRGDLDGIAINTTGIGVCQEPIRDAGLEPGDLIVVSGPIGDHGMALLVAREGLPVEGGVESDVAPVWPLVARALEVGGVHAMKDPTRGGLAAALNEMAHKSGVGILVQEETVPIRPQVKGMAEMLGISPFMLACEGRVVFGVSRDRAEAVLKAIREDPLGREAAIIGEVTAEYPGRVVLETRVGGKRYLEMPLGDPIPRIC